MHLPLRIFAYSKILNFMPDEPFTFHPDPVFLTTKQRNARTYSLPLLITALLNHLVAGTTPTLANQGVAPTLSINLSGNIAFVIA